MEEIKKAFSRCLQQALEKEGAPNKSELARMIDKTPTYIHDLCSGRTAGTEETRRAIAAALGLNYNEMIGDATGFWLRIRDLNIKIDKEAIDDEIVAAGIIQVVPKVEVDSAIAGIVRNREDLESWRLVLARDKSQVVVEMPDSSMEDMICQGQELVVALGAVQIDDIVDGDLYLVDEPSVVAIRQVFVERTRLNENLLILTSLNNKQAPPQVLPETEIKAIKGHVVRVCEINNAKGLQVKTA